jgi:DNA mismatch repair protein MutL
MQPRIWILSPEVSERIAAGEVVERPASVVKELVENALDAGAKRVTVETESGGKGLIRVTDDGQGMTADEVRLAIQRHATSKLRSAEDLFDIHTLGFRGEALPSIAAVSEMEILTRTPESEHGVRLQIHGGVVVSEQPAPAPVGTSIRVGRLFFNVPVREKFLRSDPAESGQITEWLQRLALSRPGVSFRLVHDGREALLSPGSQDPLNAVVAVLGRNVARDLLRIPEPAYGSDREPRLTVTGFVGRPTLTRANRGLQHLYVNGRSVRSPLLYRALDDAFRATMPHGRYPVAVLFLDVPPGFVDVNVHPAKVEVRFQDEQAVHGAVLRSAQSALRADTEHAAETGVLMDAPTAVSSPRVAEPGSPAPPLAGPTPFADSAIGGLTPQERRQSYHRRDPGMEPPASPRDPTYRWQPPHPRSDPTADLRDPFAEPVPPHPQSGTVPSPVGEGQGGGTEPLPRYDDPTREGEAPGEPGLRVELGSPAPPVVGRPAIGDLRPIGQVRDLFILAEGEGRLWIIDQHVAHERILFDRMTAPVAVSEPAERLLIPAALEVDRPRALALEEHRELLGELGFEVEAFGPGLYRLASVPRSLVGRNYESVFRDLTDELFEQSGGGTTRLRKDQVAAAAAGRSCKRAVKAGQPLSQAEMRRLLEELRLTRSPYTCPHGRPVFLAYEPEEIARLFGAQTCG